MMAEEVKAEAEHDSLLQDLTFNIKSSTEARKTKKAQAAIDAKADLDETQATRDDDMKYLKDITATCEAKASDFESRQKMREEEFKAIEKAIQIIESEVQGAADEHLPKFIQVRAST